MADLHLRRRLPYSVKCGFDYVVRQNLANSDCILRQYRNHLLHGEYFNVLLNARVFSAREMALVRNARFAESFS